MQLLRGEAGVGKTALLEYVAEQASGYRVMRVVGVQSEMELAYAGLHQLCAGLLEGLAALLSMLNACAPGVAVVNIDNGYGAGYLAAQIAAPV